MEEILKQFRISQKKLSNLEQLILNVQSEKHALEEELQFLRRELEDKEQEINMLHEKYEAAKLAQNLNPSLDSSELTAKIDKYLKEIDICLRYFGVQE